MDEVTAGGIHLRVIRAQFIFKTTGPEEIIDRRPGIDKRRLSAVTFTMADPEVWRG